MTKTETLKLTEVTMDMKYTKKEQEAQRKKLDAGASTNYFTGRLVG